MTRNLDVAVARVIGWTFPDGAMTHFGVDPKDRAHKFVPLYSEDGGAALALLEMFPSSVTSPKAGETGWTCTVNGVSASGGTFAEAVAQAVAAHGEKNACTS